jgi:hypothetical protein
MTETIVTPERFAQGRTFEQYLAWIGTPENLAREAFGRYHADGGSIGAPRKDNTAVFRERYERTRLSDHQIAAIRWLAAQPKAPAKLLVISEDWSSDCRRDVPILARLAEAGGLELRIFDRDGKKILGTRRPDPATAEPGANHDLMLAFMNNKDGAEWASVPVAVFSTRRTSRSCTAITSTRRSITRIACAVISRRLVPVKRRSRRTRGRRRSSSRCSTRRSSTCGPRRRSTSS